MCIYAIKEVKGLFDSKTEKIMFPPCFDDLMIYLAYDASSRHPKERQRILKSVFKGDKFITNLIDSARGE